jgi:hypothetical protein
VIWANNLATPAYGNLVSYTSMKVSFSCDRGLLSDLLHKIANVDLIAIRDQTMPIVPVKLQYLV